jgi:hypothetical protein
MAKYNKKSKTRRVRNASKKNRSGGNETSVKGCVGIEKGIRIDQKRINLSDWDPYYPGTGIYRGEVNCGDKEPNGKGRASGTGTWESDNVLHGPDETFMNPNAKKSGTVVSGTWKNNMPYQVTVTTPKGTFNYEKKTHEMTQQHIRDSIESKSSRASTVSDRSSIASVDSEYDFRDSYASMGSKPVRGSWHAKKTGGRRRKSRKSRKTRRRKRKN